MPERGRELAPESELELAVVVPVSRPASEESEQTVEIEFASGPAVEPAAELEPVEPA